MVPPVPTPMHTHTNSVQWLVHSIDALPAHNELDMCMESLVLADSFAVTVLSYIGNHVLPMLTSWKPPCSRAA